MACLHSLGEEEVPRLGGLGEKGVLELLFLAVLEAVRLSLWVCWNKGMGCCFGWGAKKEVVLAQSVVVMMIMLPRRTRPCMPQPPANTDTTVSRGGWHAACAACNGVM